MSESIRNIHAVLAALLDQSRPLWRPEEFGQILQALLAEDLVATLAGSGPPEEARTWRRIADQAAPACRTIGDLLEHPQPPLALLERVKVWTKGCRQRPDGDVPGEVAILVYYAAIAAARVRLGRRVSSLDDAELLNGFTWAIDQPWAEERLRALLREARAGLTLGAEGPATSE